jgi:hypothetical protein
LIPVVWVALCRVVFVAVHDLVHTIPGCETIVLAPPTNSTSPRSPIGGILTTDGAVTDKVRLT